MNSDGKKLTSSITTIIVNYNSYPLRTRLSPFMLKAWGVHVSMAPYYNNLNYNSYQWSIRLSPFMLNTWRVHVSLAN